MARGRDPHPASSEQARSDRRAALERAPLIIIVERASAVTRLASLHPPGGRSGATFVCTRRARTCDTHGRASAAVDSAVRAGEREGPLDPSVAHRKRLQRNRLCGRRPGRPAAARIPGVRVRRPGPLHLRARDPRRRARDACAPAPAPQRAGFAPRPGRAASPCVRVPRPSPCAFPGVPPRAGAACGPAAREAPRPSASCSPAACEASRPGPCGAPACGSWRANRAASPPPLKGENSRFGGVRPELRALCATPAGFC
jgi:hypothetical protein